MIKRCFKCNKMITILSKSHIIDNQILCKNCALENSNAKTLERTYGWYSREDEYYSGLIIENGIKTYLAFKPIVTNEELEINREKINSLPIDIRNKILEIPQYKIFFKKVISTHTAEHSLFSEKSVPYYVTQNNPVEIILPQNNGLYYDPVKDSAAYKMVIEEVSQIAKQKHKEHMIKHFGEEYVIGGIHIYYAIEAHILYEKYGIYCINNPMSLNKGLYLD